MPPPGLSLAEGLGAVPPSMPSMPAPAAPLPPPDLADRRQQFATGAIGQRFIEGDIDPGIYGRSGRGVPAGDVVLPTPRSSFENVTPRARTYQGEREAAEEERQFWGGELDPSVAARRIKLVPPKGRGKTKSLLDT